MNFSGALVGGVGLNGRGYPKKLALRHSSPVVMLDIKLCN